MLWLARELKRRLDRPDHLALIQEGITWVEALEVIDETILSRLVRNEPKRKRSSSGRGNTSQSGSKDSR
jgi:hypothetical protein